MTIVHLGEGAASLIYINNPSLPKIIMGDNVRNVSHI